MDWSRKIGLVGHMLWQIKEEKKGTRRKAKEERRTWVLSFYLVLLTCSPPLLFFEPFVRQGNFQPFSRSLLFHDLNLAYPGF